MRSLGDFPMIVIGMSFKQMLYCHILGTF